MTHQDLSSAAAAALAVESLPAARAWSARDRWAWVTEAELTARVRDHLLRGGLNAAEIRMNAQGRLSAGATNADIEIGYSVREAIEVVFAFARAAPSPGKALDHDLNWLQQGSLRHVVAFFPALQAGYRVQNNRTPYDLTCSPLSLGPDDFLLSDAIGVGSLSASSHCLLSGIVQPVQNLTRGKRPRWSIAGTPTAQWQANIANRLVQRTVCGVRTDRFWAVVWSTQ